MKKVSWFALFGVAVVSGSPALAQGVVRVSVGPGGVQGNGPSYVPAISADGRFEAFLSLASNLVPSDMNGAVDVFVRDRLTGTTERVSVDSTGAEVFGNFSNPSISADGRFVAYECDAAGLVAGDTNGTFDVFVRDRQLGTTERVSVATGGAQGNGPSTKPSISADGRYVAFLSNATTLAGADANGSATDVYLRDRQTATTVRLSVDSGGIQGNASCGSVSMSPDGRWVVFASQASNLVPADTNATDDVFLRDRQLNTTERVSVGAAGAQSNDFSPGGTVSPDGRYVVFWSIASNLVAGDTNGSTDIFLRDRQLGTTERLSVDSSGVQGNQASDTCSISSDARFVTFSSYSTNLVAGDSNGVMDVFLRDRQTSTTRRLSVDSSGAQGNATSGAPVLSTNGRFAAFWSVATNLVPGDTNAVDDVFLVDLQSGTNLITQRVNLDSLGVQANAVSQVSSISADGRYVVFQSNATNLVAGDTNGVQDIFVRDRQTGATERVNVGPGGVEADNGDSTTGYRGTISADGRYVVFQSPADNLVPGDTNGFGDIFVRDRLAGSTERVSLDSSGNQANGPNGPGGISGDGRYVVFTSAATNLVPGDTNGMNDVFVRDRLFGLTERASVDSVGLQSNGTSFFPCISADGRCVVFDSAATNLIAGDTGSHVDVFAHDRQTGLTERVSVSTAGVGGNGDSHSGMPSADGRYVAFWSYASNLVSGDTISDEDVFVRDRQSNTTERVSAGPGEGDSVNASISADGRFVTFDSNGQYVAADTNAISDSYIRDRLTGGVEMISFGPAGGLANADSYGSVVSADGRFVLFQSLATNLASGDTNGVLDLFVRDRFAAPVLVNVCDAGINGVHACPCANAPSGPGRGCNNSAGTGGAVLAASGGAYLSSDSLVFTTSGEKPTATSVLMQGKALVSAGVVYGQGVRCAGGTLKRLFIKPASGGSITAPNFAAAEPTISAQSLAKGDLISVGQSRWYFVYYRDPIVLGGCPATSTFNTSQTGVVAWAP